VRAIASESAYGYVRKIPYQEPAVWHACTTVRTGVAKKRGFLFGQPGDTSVLRMQLQAF